MKTYILSFIVGLLLGSAIVFAVTSPSMAPSEQPNMPESQPAEEPEPEQQLSISYINTDATEVNSLNIAAGDTVSSPLTITGEATGAWFFEGTAPITVVDWNGLIIGQGFIEAQGNWMTTNLVPFTGDVTFTPNTTVSDVGAVILQNHNASGLPQFDKAVEIPIFF
jgi:hypothetical protein